MGFRSIASRSREEIAPSTHLGQAAAPGLKEEREKLRRPSSHKQWVRKSGTQFMQHMLGDRVLSYNLAQISRCGGEGDLTGGW